MLQRPGTFTASVFCSSTSPFGDQSHILVLVYPFLLGSIQLLATCKKSLKVSSTYRGFGHGGTPSYHPFLDGFSTDHPAIGVPPCLWKPPYVVPPMFWIKIKIPTVSRCSLLFPWVEVATEQNSLRLAEWFERTEWLLMIAALRLWFFGTQIATKTCQAKLKLAKKRKERADEAVNQTTIYWC